MPHADLLAQTFLQAKAKVDDKPDYNKVRDAISEIIAGEKAEEYDDGECPSLGLFLG